MEPLVIATAFVIAAVVVATAVQARRLAAQERAAREHRRIRALKLWLDHEKDIGRTLEQVLTHSRLQGLDPAEVERYWRGRRAPRSGEG